MNYFMSIFLLSDQNVTLSNDVFRLQHVRHHHVPTVSRKQIYVGIGQGDCISLAPLDHIHRIGTRVLYVNGLVETSPIKLSHRDKISWFGKTLSTGPRHRYILYTCTVLRHRLFNDIHWLAETVSPVPRTQPAATSTIWQPWQTTCRYVILIAMTLTSGR